MAHFVRHLRRVGHRSGDFLPEQGVVTAAQALRGLFDRFPAHAQFFRHLGVGGFASAGHQKYAQPLEHAGLAGFAILLFQAVEYLVQQRHGPTPIKKLVRAAVIHGFQIVPMLGRPCIQGEQRLAAAALLRAGAIAGVRQEIVQPGEQKRTEPPVARSGAREGLAFEQLEQEGLRQVLGVFMATPAPPDIVLFDIRHQCRMLDVMDAQSSGKPRQAVIWGRFSSDKQADGDSKERQDRLNSALAKREGIKVIGEHFDEGVSVKDGATPLFRKVIAGLPPGAGIITENLDRISRGHPWRAKAYIADILEAGHFIITSQDGREYNSASIEQIETLLLGDLATNVARYENNKRTKRVREEKAKAIDLARQGKPSPLGAWLPSHLRYDFEAQTYVITEEIKAVTERIFAEYTQGKGTSNIARGLNEDRILTFGSKKAGRWTRSTIGELLRYEGTIGTLTIKGERMPKAFPPAISETLFYRVQGMLQANKGRHGNYASPRVNNVLRGICRCAKCGSGMKVLKHKYIACSGYREGKCDIKHMLPFQEMEYEFVKWFVPQAKDALLGKDESATNIKALQGKRSAIQKRIETTIELLDAGIAVNEIKSRLLKLEKEKQAVENELANTNAEQVSNASLPDMTLNSVSRDQRFVFLLRR